MLALSSTWLTPITQAQNQQTTLLQKRAYGRKREVVLRVDQPPKRLEHYTRKRWHSLGRNMIIDSI